MITSGEAPSTGRTAVHRCRRGGRSPGPDRERLPMDWIPLDTVYTWREARERGATRRQIRDDGMAVARGACVSSAVADTLAARCRAWAKLLPVDAAFGLETAAALLGAPVRPPGHVQIVLRPRRVLPQRRGLSVHVRRLLGEDVIEVDGLRVASPAQIFLDLAARLPAAELVALGDHLLRAGWLREDALGRRLARADRVRGVVRARELAPLLTPRAGSRPESLIRYWLLTSALPDPEVQVPVFDGWGREVAHADLGYPRWKVALEYEGRQHAEREQFGRDVDRYSLMAADGWLVLRFADRHLAGPWTVVERTRRALASRGWR